MLPADIPWLKEHVKCVLCEDTKGIVAERDGVIVAMYVLDSWSHNSVQCHHAVLDPLAFKHGIHIEVVRYVFGVCGRKLIIGLTPANNAKAVRIAKHLGFTEHTRIPDAYDVGVDYIIFRMTAEECPYYEESRHADRTAA